jgi:predicted house-cleaning NTP pyrophosphatase (Maf/HAM1 superfamily)
MSNESWPTDPKTRARVEVLNEQAIERYLAAVEPAQRAAALELVRLAIAKTREECAAIADDYWFCLGRTVASRIRALK